MTPRGLAALAAGVLLVGAVGARLLSGAPDSSRSLMGELVQTRPDRAFAARLSIPTNYQPCTPAPDSATTSAVPVPRESCGEGDDPPLDLDAFAEGGTSADPDSLQASALASVIWWDESERSIHRAITRLEKALRLSRRDVPVLVNLSAAHLVRAERTQNSRDVMVALDFARQALSRDPCNHAALFNAALALQALGTSGEATKAWDVYLAADSASPWAEEARSRKRALPPASAPRRPMPGASAEEVRAFATAWPQQARLLGWDTVLGEWGTAVEKGDPAAAALQLALAEALGEALEEGGGDLTLADAVRVIRAAQTDERATSELAWAHRQYSDAQAAYFSRYGEAGPFFERIVRARPPSPALMMWAELFAAGALVYGEQHGAARSAFKSLLSRVDTVRHPAIEARARWMYGTLLSREDSFQQARTQYLRAESLFERLGEAEYQGAILNMEGTAAHDLGDTLAAYRSMHRAMRAFRTYQHSVRLHNQLLDLADRAVRDGMPHAASPLLDEVVLVAPRVGEAVPRIEAFLARADLRALSGDTAGAARDLDSVAPLAPSVGNSTARAWVAARLQFTRAVMNAGTSNAPSAAAMDSAVAYFAEAESAAWLLPALLRRADMRLAAGDVGRATDDLGRATARIRDLSGRERNATLRSAMMEQARSRFDQLVMLHVRARNSAEALRTLEHGRTSFTSARQGQGPLTAPVGAVAVEYALIGDTLLTWTLRGDRLHLHLQTLDRAELLRTVEEVAAALESPSGDARSLPRLQRLYDVLIRPVRDRLGARDAPLVILADGEIAGVPFAALHDSVRGVYLVADHPIRFAATLADARRTLSARQRASGPALLVADPAFDRGLNPTLDRLPGAEAEVDSLRAIYPQAVVLRHDAATPDALTSQAGQARVIHYAGHAVFDDARPERSMLVLAGANGTGQLTAEAVQQLRLPDVRLVVLSACGTLRSREGRSGGFAGFSGALLAAGAGGVVGSLWPVDDGRTQHLMLVFHREYAKSNDAAGALRKAQLTMMESRGELGSPATWAGFRYAGS
jgi:CHAT domain-containing protein